MSVLVVCHLFHEKLKTRKRFNESHFVIKVKKKNEAVANDLFCRAYYQLLLNVVEVLKSPAASQEIFHHKYHKVSSPAAPRPLQLHAKDLRLSVTKHIVIITVLNLSKPA